jgi:uncharacterized protein YndB with AHSA1/START domain
MDRLTIRKDAALAADPLRVFAALTTPGEIVRFFPYRSAEVDGRVGGALVFRGEFGGQPFADFGQVTAWEPGREFAYTYWSDNHGTPRTPENHLSIRYLMEPGGDGGTRLRVEHGNVPAGPYHDGMDAAWDGLLASLAGYVGGSGDDR